MARVMISTYRFHGESDDIQVVLEGGPVEDGIGAPVLTVDTARLVLQTRLYHTGSGQHMTGRLVQLFGGFAHHVCAPAAQYVLPVLILSI